MNRLLAAAMILLQVVTATGCMTTRVGGTMVAPINLQKIQAEVKAGDRLKVRTTAGRNIRMKVVGVNEAEISGVLSGGTSIDLTFDQIDSIEIQQPSRDRTWAVIGGVTLTFIAIIAVSVFAISSGGIMVAGP